MAALLDEKALLDLATARLAPLARALALLQYVGEAAEAIPLGDRDRTLLGLWSATFGDAIACVETCPACGARLEFDLAASALAANSDAAEGSRMAVVGGRERRLRRLTTADLLAVDGLPRLEARARLAAACADGGPPLVPSEVDEVEAWLEAADPMAFVSIGLSCGVCGTGWERPLDVVGLLWAECTARGRRLMQEIASLAAAFGWTEAECLAVPAGRRQAYVELATP